MFDPVLLATLMAMAAPQTATTEAPPAPGLQITLSTVLTAIGQGNCPNALLSGDLAAMCARQIAGIRGRLERLGTVKRAVFVGMRPLPDGSPSPAYRVEFERGTMTWLANADSAGRIVTLWTGD
jgi:hypothetical protein